MDPFSPISGISLERYAELSALVSDVWQDAERSAQLVAAQGVSRADWEAAKVGWTARMQDPSLMGQVATVYMPLYNAALAKKAPVVQLPSFEDYVALSGAAKGLGLEAALRHYGLDMTQWTQIAMHWNGQMAADMPRYASFGPRVEQEGARIAQGGPPRPLGQPGMPPQPGAQNFDRQADQAVREVGKAAAFGFNALGSALGALGNAVTGFGVGARVLVTWSDGQRYPATVAAVGQGQYYVTMTDGKQHWIPSAYVAAG